MTTFTIVPVEIMATFVSVITDVFIDLDSVAIFSSGPMTFTWNCTVVHILLKEFHKEIHNCRFFGKSIPTLECRVAVYPTYLHCTLEYSVPHM